MPNILVIGGTRYFGKRLVWSLVEAGHEVTLVNRGKTPDPFESRVTRVTADRSDEAAFVRAWKESLQDKLWDVVYDQVCYSPSEAALICGMFSGRVGHYVFTSTQSVYQNAGLQKEESFDPHVIPIRWGGPDVFRYDEGKRLAEAVFFQQAPFPVSAVRIPIVLGPDDYTRRLQFHIERIKGGRPIVVENPDAAVSLITSQEVASFLEWVAGTGVTGPINACSDGTMTIGEIIDLIAQLSGQKARMDARGDDADQTPFAGPESRILDATRAKDMGFAFQQVRTWLPELVKEHL